MTIPKPCWCLYYAWTDTDGKNMCAVGENGDILWIDDTKPLRASEIGKLKLFESKYEAYMWRNFHMIDDSECDKINDHLSDMRATTTVCMEAWLKDMWPEPKPEPEWGVASFTIQVHQDHETVGGPYVASGLMRLHPRDYVIGGPGRDRWTDFEEIVVVARVGGNYKHGMRDVSWLNIECKLDLLDSCLADIEAALEADGQERRMYEESGAKAEKYLEWIGWCNSVDGLGKAIETAQTMINEWREKGSPAVEVY